MRGAVRLAIPVAVAAGLVLGEAARALYEQMTTLGVGTVRVAAQSGPVVTRSVLASDVSSTSTAFADTALSLALAANTTYTLRCVLVHTSAATTTAPQVALNGPASPTGLRYVVETGTSATATHRASQTAYDTVTNPATGGGAVALPIRVDGYIQNGANAGNLVVRLRSEVNASTVTLLARSFCELMTV